MKTFLGYALCATIGASLAAICIFIPLLIGW